MWEILQTPELERALLIAIIAGPIMGLLGTFITLRGMAFFSDAISHAALTGVGLGIALHLANDVYGPGMQFVLIVFCCLVGLMMAWLFERTSLRADTVIAFSYSGAVALGVILISQLKGLSKPRRRIVWRNTFRLEPGRLDDLRTERRGPWLFCC